MTQLDVGARNCSCNVDCEEVDYALTLSTSVWPSEQYEPLAQENYGTDMRQRDVDIAANLLKVNAYYASLNVQTVTEVPVYSSVSFLIWNAIPRLL